MEVQSKDKEIKKPKLAIKTENQYSDEEADVMQFDNSMRRVNNDIRCFGCGKKGHPIAKCPKNPVTMNCYRCGSPSHKKEECTAKGNFRNNDFRYRKVCYACGGKDHLHNVCSEAVCFECGEKGHMSRSCPKKGGDPSQESLGEDYDDKLIADSEDGGESYGKYRSNAGGGINADIRCFRCGQKGHPVRKCPVSANLASCDQCGSSEHRKEDCTMRRNRKIEYQSRKECYACGEMGHIRSACTQATCFKCGKKGHMSRSCPERGTGGEGGDFDNGKMSDDRRGETESESED